MNRKAQRLTVFNGNETVIGYFVSTGMEGLETPRGVYVVSEKTKNPPYTYPYSDWVPDWLKGQTFESGSEYNPLVGAWIGLKGEAQIAGIGIHGTRDREDIGTIASHGCIRMRRKDVLDLYDRVGPDMKVVII